MSGLPSSPPPYLLEVPSMLDPFGGRWTAPSDADVPDVLAIPACQTGHGTYRVEVGGVMLVETGLHARLHAWPRWAEPDIEHAGLRQACHGRSKAL